MRFKGVTGCRTLGGRPSANFAEGPTPSATYPAGEASGTPKGLPPLSTAKARVCGPTPG